MLHKEGKAASPNHHPITKNYFNPFNLGGVFSWCYACSSVVQRTFSYLTRSPLAPLRKVRSSLAFISGTLV
ncbi:hypothetical protein LC613_27510 [Nostoc sphaeroides CHAB 2801]|uniref:Uncharacterized protein n=1 Tax=Nostoc sphaeroides CCNUC1 TaxID=2653204 RepID=A0A5P8W4W0_9NOSO|nr:hypothetical protein [Nostoc sphaeroides]MCC5631498.1 hypothetical protein [Nostoc sphaeroides CHAB 2801]QFS47777.1 hypothetical protein GXM_05269 [Nostoc sphaeroides CCNUC1]